MFSCEFWEISKNTFFTEHLQWLHLQMVWGNKIAMLICEVNGPEVNFELNLSKYSKTFRGVILVKADFYNQKKKKTVVHENKFLQIF